MKRFFLFFLLGFSMFSCRKKLLNELPDTGILVPRTVDDFYMLMDNENVLDLSPVLSEFSADDYYFLPSAFTGRSRVELNAYTWAPDIFEGTEGIFDYNNCYTQVMYCNVVLDAIRVAAPEMQILPECRNVKAIAYFKRAFAYYNLAQLFAPVYDSATFDQPFGVPLKLTSEVSELIKRSTIRQTYGCILDDLNQSLLFFNATHPDFKRNRPSRSAAFALLSRVYMSMRIYPEAGRFADSAMRYVSDLIDYNDVSKTASLPFQVQNAENLYTAKVPNTLTLFQTILPLAGSALIDSNLYRSYADNDLRKPIFFSTTSGLPKRKNFYDGTMFTIYTGLAVDEMYLNSAECKVRVGQYQQGMDVLNALLIKRFQKGTFTALNAGSKEEALTTVLSERRKELVMRGLRWNDLRRLNAEGADINLTRKLDNTTYTLPAGSNRYVLPLPPEVIRISGLTQNPRSL